MKNSLTQIQDKVYYVGVNDRKTDLFEGLWPIPHGVSYNSYLIVDEKITLIDTVDHAYAAQYLDNIKSIIGDKQIDYLVVNHMEPDHSSSIANIRQAYPDITIIGNAKTIQMLEGFYNIDTKILEIKDTEKLSIGEYTLSFYTIPMVHWPETMVTYLEEKETVFSCDAFGCFGALNGFILDKDIHDLDLYWREMYRYYSNIVGKYGPQVQNAIKKVSPLSIKMICPSHGPVWTEYIPKLIQIYDQLSKYESEEGVVIAYASMYGNTATSAEYIARELAGLGVKKIVLHDVSRTHVSFVLADIFKYKGLILGSPTYNNDIFPPILGLVNAIEARNVKNKVFGSFGSYSWASMSCKNLCNVATKLNWKTASKPFAFKQGFFLSPELESLSEHCKEYVALLRE